jgi:hypothetical protein
MARSRGLGDVYKRQTGYSVSGALTPAQDTALTTIYRLIRPIFHSILKLCAKFNIDLSKIGINTNEYK